MSYALFVLYWPDFTGSQPDAAPITPPLLAHSLKRQLLAKYEDFSGYCWVPSEPPSPAGAAFQRWGMRLLDTPPSAASIRTLLAQHPKASHVILAMRGERGRDLWQALSLPTLSGELWTPAGDPPPNAPAPLRVSHLEDNLHLRTGVTVGLFADWRHLVSGLAEDHLSLDRGPLMDAILRCAELAGAVVAARLYGGSDSSRSQPVAHRAAGETQNGDGAAEMRQDLLRLLDDPYAPQTWVLITEANWVPEIVAVAHSRKKRVLLWTVRDEAIPLSVRLQADGYADLRHFLPRSLFSPPRKPQEFQVLRSRIRPSVQTETRGVPDTQVSQGSAEADTHTSDPGVGIPDTDGSVGDRSESLEGRALPLLPVVVHARLSPWVRLAYLIERTLREYQAPRIAFRRLASILAAHEEFGPTPAAALSWLNRARAEGLLLLEQEHLQNEPTASLITCRPNLEHPIFRAALDVPDRILRLLRQMLQKMPWVSFKLLRSVLVREQWLGGAPFNLDECAIDEWINYLIQDGAVRMTKEPNLANPEYPVTALRLNDEHPLAQSVVSEAEEGARLAAERAILAVDHFMIRHRKPWMAMSALRRALDGMGREELQAVLEGLQNLGVLITESYPNPQKQHLTTGCRLKMDETIVVDALRIRNVIVRVTHQIQRRRSWVRLADLHEELNSQESLAVTGSQRLAWISLLRDEGLLELDHEVLPLNGWGGIRCRLNLADSVVRTIVAEVDDTYAWEAGTRE